DPRRPASSAAGRWRPASTACGKSVAVQRSSIADPRIEKGIGEVDEELDEHVKAAGQKDHALDDRIIARQNGVDREPSNPGDIEDAFRYDHAADQQSEASPDYGHDRHGGIAERVPEKDDALLDAFSACRPDEIFPQHLEHARPGHAGDQGDVDRGQGQARQDGTREKASEVLGGGCITLNGKPAELDGKDLNENIADDENRN